MSLTAILVHRAITPAEEILNALILVEEGRILAVGPREGVSIPRGARVAEMLDATATPGFVDVHVHGAGGQDVMRGTSEALEVVAATLTRGGTTSFLATTVTSATEVLCRSVSGIADAITAQASRGGADSPRAEILGVHLEGPFISRVRRGVHSEEYISAPAPDLLRRLLDAASGRTRIITLAPELPGALELIDAARSMGIVVSVGHTDANYEQAMAAIHRGARHAAHVFNAMRPFGHRDSGVIGAVLTRPEICAELIADGVHVDAAAMQVLLRAKGTEGVTLVSDGTAATGMPDGCYRLGDFDIAVSGGVVRNKEGKLAGSTLTLDRALRNIVSLGVRLKDAVQMMTLNPARELGLEKTKGSLTSGADADLVFLNRELEIVKVVTRGVGLV
ncbi:MAG TPA: N-acetylglucosamine-6-phosphate deacetylase [Candidatus Acidoferrales bacterium]|nr:N-acetylglucosamine-6-phosphate deacetylase [Candidatus Acidoferrales bacterium]